MYSQTWARQVLDRFRKSYTRVGFIEQHIVSACKFYRISITPDDIETCLLSSLQKDNEIERGGALWRKFRKLVNSVPNSSRERELLFEVTTMIMEKVDVEILSRQLWED